MIRYRRAAQTLRRSRLRTVLICTILACFVPVALMAAPAGASTSAQHHKPVHRVGGPVHRSWPYRGKAPPTALARWLARQVGPAKVKRCTRRVNGKLVRCHRAKSPRKNVVIPRLPGKPAIAAQAQPPDPQASPVPARGR